MRVRKDPTSWRAGGVLRRDSRSSKPSDAHKPVAGKKDTRRWCGGKVGREHSLQCMDYRTVKRVKREGIPERNAAWRVLACTVCGKELDHWWPWPELPRLGKPKPDWVTF